MNDKDPKLERSAAENAAPEQTEGTPGKKPSAARARKKRELSERISGYSADYRGAYGERREMDDLPEDPEIDDFLPEGEGSMDEKMLSKWEDDFGPVSYTHLDVYKRQPLHSAKNPRWLSRLLPQRRKSQ